MATRKWKVNGRVISIGSVMGALLILGGYLMAREGTPAGPTAGETIGGPASVLLPGQAPASSIRPGPIVAAGQLEEAYARKAPRGRFQGRPNAVQGITGSARPETAPQPSTNAGNTEKTDKGK